LWNRFGRDGCSYTVFACESISYAAGICQNVRHEMCFNGKKKSVNAEFM